MARIMSNPSGFAPVGGFHHYRAHIVRFRLEAPAFAGGTIGGSKSAGCMIGR